MSRRNRWVPSSAVQTPERGAPPLSTPEAAEQLEQREEEPPIEEEDDEPAPPAPEPPTRSEREVRLAAARAMKPDAAHWAAVWVAGRDAAVVALEGGTAIAAVYALAPPEGVGCRDCWMRGRDAALRVIQGV